MWQLHQAELEKPEKLGPTGSLNFKENYQDLIFLKPEGKQNAIKRKNPPSAPTFTTQSKTKKINLHNQHKTELSILNLDQWEARKDSGAGYELVIIVYYYYIAEIFIHLSIVFASIDPVK